MISKDSNYKYWAFISYSHQDHLWGKWLHKKLETHGIPKEFVGQPLLESDHIPRKLYRCFIDEQEMPATGDLPAYIDNALRESRYLIIVSSPAAAKSQWVSKEIDSFKRLGREGRVFALIIDGEPGATDKPGYDPEMECFPEPLRYKYTLDGQRTDERTEPLAPDVRLGKESRRTALLRLIAGIVQIEYAQLADREGRRQRLRLAAIIGLATLITLVFAVLAVTAVIQRERADKERTIARKQFYDASIQAARAQLAQGRPDLAREALWAAPYEYSNWEWGHLILKAHPGLHVLENHQGPIFDVTYSADGQYIAVASLYTHGRVWNAATGEPLFDLATDLGGDVTFSPDGRFVGAVTFGGCKVVLWNVETGERALCVEGDYFGYSPEGETASQITFSHDSDYIAINSFEKTEIWDISTNTHVSDLENSGEASLLSFAPDGSRLIGRVGENIIKIWKIDTGKILNQLEGVHFLGQGLNRPPSLDRGWVAVDQGEHVHVFNALSDRTIGIIVRPVETLAVSSDESAIAYTGNNSIAVFDTQSAKILWSHTLEGQVVSEIIFDPKGDRLAVILGQNTVVVLDAKSGGRIFEKQSSAIQSVHYSPRGTYMAVMHAEKDPEIWDGTTGKQVIEFSGHADAINDVIFSHNESSIVTGSEDTTAQIWNIPVRRTKREYRSPADGNPFNINQSRFIAADANREYTAHFRRLYDDHLLFTISDVNSAIWSPDGELILTKSAYGQLAVWDAETGTERYRIEGRFPHHSTFSPDGSRLLTAFQNDRDGDEVIVRDSVSGQVLYKKKGVSSLTDYAFSADGQRVAADTTNYGSTLIWDLYTGRISQELSGPNPMFSPIGTQLITHSDMRVRIWEELSGKLIHELNEHFDVIHDVVLSPDGTRVASGCEDGRTRIWNTETGQLEHVLRDSTYGALTATFSPDGSRLVTGTTDSKIHIWDVATGRLLHELFGPQEGGPNEIHFSHNGLFLAVQSYSNELIIWESAPWQLEDLPQVEGEFKSLEEERKSRFLEWKRLAR
ncbi:MAG: PQQ-binding-like beta-propeller repeat protein [Candidatus Thiodiazotropha sp. (ex Clathrolucina costata)]|nr:PQQ-binding-like beta-propeller repeat protein [Candidatus Thiodiazotropha taylori]